MRQTHLCSVGTYRGTRERCCIAFWSSCSRIAKFVRGSWTSQLRRFLWVNTRFYNTRSQINHGHWLKINHQHTVRQVCNIAKKPLTLSTFFVWVQVVTIQVWHTVGKIRLLTMQPSGPKYIDTTSISSYDVSKFNSNLILVKVLEYCHGRKSQFVNILVDFMYFFKKNRVSFHTCTCLA